MGSAEGLGELRTPLAGPGADPQLKSNGAFLALKSHIRWVVTISIIFIIL